MKLWNGGPGNRKDRERVSRLSPERADEASAIAEVLYDGTRTVAACWSQALDMVTATHYVCGTGDRYFSAELYPGGSA